LDYEKPETGESTNTTLSRSDSPRIDLSARQTSVRLPVKAYGAKRAFNPFFRDSQAKGNTMSDRFSSDRMAAFTPQIQKRVADIPNLATMRVNDGDIDGKRLVIGKQIRMSGEISGCEKLVVEGTVEATLSEVKTIDVTANGTFKGTAEVESAVIAGAYEGTLTVNGHLEVAASGVVKGSVSYKTIMVANGGKLLGTIASIES
jgi:cytoskeletal protein CcmA (bactofilin family)